MPEIINGEVVETIKTDLAVFIENKQRELDMISMEINNLQTTQQNILAELQNLLQ